MSTTRSKWLGAATVAGLSGLGLYLRWRDVGVQVLGGDELHALRAAARDKSVLELLAHHTAADNSIPLTVYARLLANLGAFSELSFRLPSIVSGALLVLAPWLFRRVVGARACLIATALMAVWPMCVYYSFVARPYGPAAFLFLLALLGWQRWLVEGHGRALYLFSVAGALACYLHLLCLFPLAWLFSAGWLEARRDRDRMRELLRAALVAGALGLVTLGPGLPGLIELRLLEVVRPETATPAMAWKGYLLLAGTEPVTALLLLGLAGLGTWSLALQSRSCARALAGTLPALLVGMFATQPPPIVDAWARYLFLVWPVFVLLAAVGVVCLLDAAARGPRSREPAGFGAAALASVALVAGVLALSPTPILSRAPDSLRGRRSALEARGASAAVRARARVSPFFASIAGDPDSGSALVVWPLDSRWRTWEQLAADQAAHGLDVLVATPERVYAHAPFRFTRAVDHHDVDSLRRRGVRYVVLDLELAAALIAEHPTRWNMKKVQRGFEQPSYRDERILVRDLGP